MKGRTLAQETSEDDNISIQDHFHSAPHSPSSIIYAHTVPIHQVPNSATHSVSPHSLLEFTHKPENVSQMDGGGDPERQQALEQYKNKLLESREWESKLKALRMDIKGLQKDFETTEDNIKALQSVGQIIGEVLKQLDEERCKSPTKPCLVNRKGR